MHIDRSLAGPIWVRTWLLPGSCLELVALVGLLLGSCWPLVGLVGLLLSGSLEKVLRFVALALTNILILAGVL